MSGVSEGSNLMDELRHVQLLLKREEIFNEFQANEIKELNQSLRNESQKVLYLQKFLIYLHMCSMGDRAVNLTPVFFDSLLKDVQEKQAQQPPSSPTQVNTYNKVISSFTENLDLLAKSCAELAQSKPEQIDQLTFSTIPGLFGYLWSAEAAQSFLNFMQKLVSISLPVAASFARVIFAIPPFRLFFDAVVADLVNSVATVKTSEDAEKFADEFVKRWEDNASFCPGIVKTILGYAPDPVKLLMDSLITPAFKSPRVFGIVPISLRVGPEPTDLIATALESHAAKMWESLKNVDSPASLPSAEKLTKILPDLGKSALFTSDDLGNLIDLVGAASKIDESFPVKPANLERPPECAEYLSYSFTLPSVQDVQHGSQSVENMTPEDEIELQLRQMLTGVDVIPLAAQSSQNPDMVDLLKSQVQLARPDHRLLLEMKIDDFETARKKVPQSSTFDNFLSLLKQKFEERQPQRLDKLSKISLYNTEFSQMGQLSKGLKKSIEAYRDVMRFHLVEKWIHDSNPLSSIPDELCEDQNKFVAFFRDIVDKWQKWCSAGSYKPMQTNEILHNIVMRELPLERFLKSKPDLDEEDKRCHDGIVEKKTELLNQNSFDFTSTFQENPKLLEAAQRQLKQAFDAPLPLVKLHYFGEALNTLVFVLTFEGHKEVGADQWLPMTILLLVLAQPERLPSTIRYIDHFVKSLMENEQGSSDMRLINEQTEYTFTMVKSSLMHFQKSIPGISAN